MSSHVLIQWVPGRGVKTPSLASRLLSATWKYQSNRPRGCDCAVRYGESSSAKRFSGRKGLSANAARACWCPTSEVMLPRDNIGASFQ